MAECTGGGGGKTKGSREIGERKEKGNKAEILTENEKVGAWALCPKERKAK